MEEQIIERNSLKVGEIILENYQSPEEQKQMIKDLLKIEEVKKYLGVIEFETKKKGMIGVN